MVKVFYCMSDVGPGEGEFVVIPGSHKAMFKLAWEGHWLEGDVKVRLIAAGYVVERCGVTACGF